jgi:uncharacterized protein (TIGR01777 family)
MKVAVTGASGLVGSALVPVLRDAGHEVLTLTRRAPEGDSQVAWDPVAGTVDAARLEGVEAIVHLAGENIGRRWSGEARKRIVSSRIEGTGLIARTAAALESRPALVQASAIGYYGFENPTATEASSKGGGFAADVVAAWEQAAEPAREAGLRWVALRKAPILAREGGVVAEMMLPFKLGVGGRVGSGRQSWSWLALADAARAYQHALESELTGPVNVVGGTATNEEFVKAFGRALHRPTILPLPAFAVKAMFGQMGEEYLLGGQRVSSEKLEQSGFAFEYTQLDAALEAALAR